MSKLTDSNFALFSLLQLWLWLKEGYSGEMSLWSKEPLQDASSNHQIKQINGWVQDFFPFKYVLPSIDRILKELARNLTNYMKMKKIIIYYKG